MNRDGHKRVAVNAEARLGDTDIEATDKVVDVCPVGALLRKRVGYAVPVGKRLYDHEPIGSDIADGQEPRVRQRQQRAEDIGAAAVDPDAAGRDPFARGHGAILAER